jgi:hypothetical protein
VRITVPKAPAKVQLCIGASCQYFICVKKALRFIQGKAICGLTNDPCIGYKCQYAACSAHAMAPNGECTLNMRDKEVKDVAEEAKKMEKDVSKIKSHLKKLGLDDYI